MNTHEELEPLIECDNCGKFICPDIEGSTCTKCLEEFYEEFYGEYRGE